MIAYCGMDCSKCEGYLATQANSDAKRKEVAEKWTVQLCDGVRESLMRPDVNIQYRISNL